MLLVGLLLALIERTAGLIAPPSEPHVCTEPLRFDRYCDRGFSALELMCGPGGGEADLEDFMVVCDSISEGACGARFIANVPFVVPVPRPRSTCHFNADARLEIVPVNGTNLAKTYNGFWGWM